MNFISKFLNLFRPAENGGGAGRPSSPAGPPATLLAAPPGPFEIGPLTVSQQAIDLIVEFEVGDRTYYNKKLTRPTWPGAKSGVTIGFGYDLGYNTADRIFSDWEGLDPTKRQALARLAGVKGEPAKRLVASVSHISVPWELAQQVFRNITLPRYARQAAGTFPNLVKCHPHVQGAILSLVFNRGPALKGPNRQDMNDIYRILSNGIQQGDIQAIASEIRQMKSIWANQNLGGLIRRREAEAKLVESSLSL